MELIYSLSNNIFNNVQFLSLTDTTENYFNYDNLISVLIPAIAAVIGSFVTYKVSKNTEKNSQDKILNDKFTSLISDYAKQAEVFKEESEKNREESEKNREAYNKLHDENLALKEMITDLKNENKKILASNEELISKNAELMQRNAELMEKNAELLDKLERLRNNSDIENI